jgi:hypothetical protein
LGNFGILGNCLVPQLLCSSAFQRFRLSDHQITRDHPITVITQSFLINGNFLVPPIPLFLCVSKVLGLYFTDLWQFS